MLDDTTPAIGPTAEFGTAVGDLYPNHWNNRHISWSFIPAPDYSGDIRIGFLQGAQVAVATDGQLENGLRILRDVLLGPLVLHEVDGVRPALAGDRFDAGNSLDMQ